MLCSLLTTLGFLKIFQPVYLGHFFALDSPTALFAISSGLLAFGIWYGPLKSLAGSLLLRTFGSTLLVIGLASVLSPTLLGLRNTFLPLADVFVIIESGIILQLIGLEPKIMPVTTSLAYGNFFSQLLLQSLSRPRTATASPR